MTFFSKQQQQRKTFISEIFRFDVTSLGCRWHVCIRHENAKSSELFCSDVDVSIWSGGTFMASQSCWRLGFCAFLALKFQFCSLATLFHLTSRSSEICKTFSLSIGASARNRKCILTCNKCRRSRAEGITLNRHSLSGGTCLMASFLTVNWLHIHNAFCWLGNRCTFNMRQL